MEIWTDGTSTVHACDTASVVRVFRGPDEVAAARPEKPLAWQTPLAVDPGADRVWAGRTVEEFRLSDLAPVRTHDDRVLRMTALGDGRLAAVLPARDGTSPCRLAVGTPGAWEREIDLDESLADLCAVRPGIAITTATPHSRAVGGDPTLTATEHGIVVADGQRGVVAHFTTDLELLGLWYSGGVDETELIGYATADGIVTTARWAARDSQIGILTDDAPRKLLWEYGAFAVPAPDGRIWVVGNFDILLLDRDGERIAMARGPRALVQAVHAHGTTCAIGTDESVTLAIAEHDGITTRTADLREPVAGHGQPASSTSARS